MLRKKRLEAKFAVGDLVEVAATYAMTHPGRDCSGQACIAQVAVMFGKVCYGVAFPNLRPGWKFYWVNGGLLSPVAFEG
jgi:hypothetical protein